MHKFIVISTVSALALTVILAFAIREARKAKATRTVYAALIVLLGLQAGLAGGGFLLLAVGTQVCGW